MTAIEWFGLIGFALLGLGFVAHLYKANLDKLRLDALQTYQWKIMCINREFAVLAGSPPKPGPMMTLEPLEAIPQRDYRKELWIAHWAAIDGKTKFEDAVCGTQKAVEAFDKFFSEPTNG